MKSQSELFKYRLSDSIKYRYVHHINNLLNTTQNVFQLRINIRCIHCAVLSYLRPIAWDDFRPSKLLCSTDLRHQVTEGATLVNNTYVLTYFSECDGLRHHISTL